MELEMINTPRLKELLSGRHSGKTVFLLGQKQEWMVEQFICEEKDLKRLGGAHLASAELVIADLLALLDKARNYVTDSELRAEITSVAPPKART
jgi:hypothetical protein